MLQIQDFLQFIAQDTSLQLQLSQATTRQAAMELAVELGQKLGYDVTNESLETALDLHYHKLTTDTEGCQKCGWFNWCDVVDTAFPLYCVPPMISEQSTETHLRYKV